jgi:hypothetical protein
MKAELESGPASKPQAIEGGAQEEDAQRPNFDKG